MASVAAPFVLLACAATPSTTTAPATGATAPAPAPAPATSAAAPTPSTPPGSSSTGTSPGSSSTAPGTATTTGPPVPPRPLAEGEGRVVQYAALGMPSYSIGALAADAGGRLWFAAGTPTQGCLNDIDPADGALTSHVRGAGGVATGADGSIWYTTERGVVRQDRDGSARTTELPGVGSEAVVRPITVDRSNRAWVTQTEADAVVRITPDGQVRTFHDGIPSGAKPGTIAAANDGGVWFTEPDVHLIGHATADGAITQLGVGGAPEIVVGAPDGGAWFFDRAAPGFGRIAADGAVRRLESTTPSAPVVDMTVAPDGSVWYVADPGITGRFGDDLPLQELPTVGANGTPMGAAFHHPKSVAAAPDGTIWFTDWFSGGEGSSIALYGVVIGSVPATWPADLPLRRPIGATLTTCGD